MSIIESELVLCRSAVVTDADANGGPMSPTAVAAGTKNAMFPDFTLAERAAGATRYRKFWWHNRNAAGLALLDPVTFLTGPTPAGDRMTLIPGSLAETQADLGTSPPETGAGLLASAASAGATSVEVSLEDAGQDIFHDGMQVWIADSADPSTRTVEEFRTVATAVKVGTQVTLTFATGEMLAGSYPAGAIVSGVLFLVDLQTEKNLDSVVTAAGTFDDAQIALDNIGAIDQEITLTFTSASAFTVVSDVKGSLGTGNISAECAPSNPDFSRPFFTIPAAAWGGTWAAGEIVRFETYSAAQSVWIKCVCPAGAASASDNTYRLALRGGSA